MIQIKVFISDEAFRDNKPCYENIVKCSQEFMDNLGFVYSSMLCIYGKSSVVTFNFMPL